MLTEFTYEAMLHANFEIKFNKIKVKSEILSSEKDSKKNKMDNINSKINSIQENGGEEENTVEEYKRLFLGMED